MKAMSIEEMVERYDISAGYGKSEGNICIHKADLLRADEMVDEIKARKAEFLAYFKKQADARYEAYKAKREIDGLAEIEAAEEEARAWREEFNRQADSEDGITVMRAYPVNKVEELEEQHPKAAAYRKAKKAAESSNDEIAEIGSKAVERIMSGEDYSKVIADMDSEMRKYADRHSWD